MRTRLSSCEELTAYREGLRARFVPNRKCVSVCGGSGCRVCGNGWIEILGAGMVHPAVLENVGYDPERYKDVISKLGIRK